MQPHSDPEFERHLLEAKLEGLAEFAAGCGHEVNNPLATISGRVQLLLKNESDPERRAALLAIGAQAYRIRDMIGDVMLIGRPPEPQPQDVDVAAALREVCEKHASLTNNRRLKVVLDVESELQCHADRTQFAVVLSELLRNAIEASPEQGTITLTASSNSDVVEFSVADDGHGLSDEEREHLFDPFYSGRQAGRGLGFGLSKCWRIVTNHGGSIVAQTRPSGGLEITTQWPTS